MQIKFTYQKLYTHLCLHFLFSQSKLLIGQFCASFNHIGRNCHLETNKWKFILIILYVKLPLTHFLTTHSELCFMAAPLVITSPFPLLRKAPPLIRLLNPEVVQANLKNKCPGFNSTCFYYQCLYSYVSVGSCNRANVRCSVPHNSHVDLRFCSVSCGPR